MSVVKWFRHVFENRTAAAEEARFFQPIDDELAFAKSESLTLGVEFELGLLEKNTYIPSHDALSIIDAAADPRVKKELFDHMVEVTTLIANNVQEAEAQLVEPLDKLQKICDARNLCLTGSGRPPTIKQKDVKRITDARYNRIYDERKILSERFCTLGMHIHLGMKDAETCVRANNFFMHFLPHLIALCASSPLENGLETGLASIRPTITESLPIAGLPYHYENWSNYKNLCHSLYKAGSIHNLKDLWWDLRPSPKYGTLEIRICDQPASLAEGMAVVAFIHLLGHWFIKHQDWIDEMPRPSQWRLRDNKWRAMRYGLDMDLIVNSIGDTRPLREDIALWLERTSEISEELEYKPYIDMLKEIMTKGNSATRQQLLWDCTHDLDVVAAHVCAEWKEQNPIWPELMCPLTERSHTGS